MTHVPHTNPDSPEFIASCDPSTILKLVAVVEKARGMLNASSECDTTAEAALRSALAALDDREPA